MRLSPWDAWSLPLRLQPLSDSCRIGCDWTFDFAWFWGWRGWLGSTFDSFPRSTLSWVASSARFQVGPGVVALDCRTCCLGSNFLIISHAQSSGVFDSNRRSFYLEASAWSCYSQPGWSTGEMAAKRNLSNPSASLQNWSRTLKWMISLANLPHCD